MQAQVLEGGFADVPVDASHAFRAVMTAMARPGEIFTISGAQPPAPLSPASGAVLLTLCDPETPLYLAASHDTPKVRDWITFHTGAPFVAAQNAMFAIGAWDDLPLSDFAIGTPEYPDRSATLIVERPTLSNTGATLRGPGIKNQAQLSLPKVQSFQDNAQLFPLGLDFIFTSGDRLAALPRTTKVT
ncbi:phosphonate C-P lyase system protein PhnH [Pacificibacter marinus]|uniref:Alpha-D-ribose 1-methylphosphonate 5-triphosphate synthase subunit PhnH n=1 Tax=Pacificibacter marinus TaxID=658057 RepID=A0A1Y5T812_9RHOB|nr:phosphonate C-P lyase system protein PhnH [Pacificibacter marinus]SEL21179.1 alpha-D-ribose 1-methylphosphonate 5-triphosphate synthase subunit PhnH [Pacificibacter marinus]SLN55889.1 Alpha-D-ribose 1-methylphosphonate 5-triphosphate synthase subunit PhnH [Pacificibacter marinus]